MATNIATLAVKFVADTTGLKVGTTQATGLLGKLGFSMAAVQGAGAALAGAMAAVGVQSYVAYKGLQQFLASAARIDITSKLAERLDLTYGSLQKLTYIAGQSDIEVGALAKAMEHMGRAMGSGGMSLEDRFAQQAKRIGAIKDPALRAAAAFKTFGKAGGELIPLMRSFAADAAKFDRFGGKFGFAIEDKDAKNVERMNDAWSDMVFIGTQLADKFVSKFGAPVAAFLENAIELTIEWASILEGVGTTWENVGGFAVSLLTQMNGWMTLFSGTSQTALGIHQQLLGTLQLQAAAISRNNNLALEGAGNLLSGITNVNQGRSDIDDVISGRAGRKFQDSIVNFGGPIKPPGQGGGGAGGGGTNSLGSYSFDRDSQAAARVINMQGQLTPAERHAEETAKNTAATKAAVDKLIAFFISSPPILGLGGP